MAFQIMAVLIIVSKGCPDKVNVHDFVDKDLGKVAPYGVYDVTANAGLCQCRHQHAQRSSLSIRSAAGWM